MQKFRFNMNIEEKEPYYLTEQEKLKIVNTIRVDFHLKRRKTFDEIDNIQDKIFDSNF